MHKVGVNIEAEAPAIITVLGLHEFFELCVKCCSLQILNKYGEK